ncbi:cupin domain-containing protein [Pseudomonas sp. KB_15]|uniref:cupin domain-containing protein n=1 Tax=Pseudomonas sp. KB_15 TaxID=3233035 RepID=UPI003F9722EF
MLSLDPVARRLRLICGLLLLSTPVFASDKLLLVERDDLMKGPANETVLGQHIWEMHKTALSHTTLIRLDMQTPVVRHDSGERTLIVLQGKVLFHFTDSEVSLGAGDYVAIPAGQAYQMTPLDHEKPLLLGFDVPVIDMAKASAVDFSTPTEAPPPVVKKQQSVMASPPGWNDPSDRGWTLIKTADKRVNLVEMFSELKNHSHPDADHSLILLSGSARVVTPTEDRILKTGDYVSIPQNVPHKYYVEGQQSALFISFDAPAYDSAKTIYFE